MRVRERIKGLAKVPQEVTIRAKIQVPWSVYFALLHTLILLNEMSKSEHQYFIWL